MKSKAEVEKRLKVLQDMKEVAPAEAPQDVSIAIKVLQWVLK